MAKVFYRIWYDCEEQKPVRKIWLVIDSDEGIAFDSNGSLVIDIEEEPLELKKTSK